jgi:hypothetical protein
MQAPYRRDLCRPRFHDAPKGSSSDGDGPSLTVDVLAEALEKLPDLRDAVVLALQQLAAAKTTTDSQKPVTKEE